MIEKIQKYWAILICVVGLAGTWATMQYRLDQQDVAIEKLEARQNNTDILLNSISEQLTAISTKMDLIIQGKITVRLEHE